MTRLFYRMSINVILTFMVCFVSSAVFGETTLWQIGKADRNYSEFSIAGNYAAYPGTFPGDVDYTIGTDSPESDWSYIQPSTSDGWAGAVQHPFLIRFDCDAWKSYVLYKLDIRLAASHNQSPPVMTIDLNGQRWQYQTTKGPGDGVLTHPSGGNFQTYTTYVKPELLRPKGNLITITTSGSWMLYDAVVFLGIETLPPVCNFAVISQPGWYNDPEGVSRKIRLDFKDGLLIEPARLSIATSQGTFKRDVNTEGLPVNYVEVLVPMSLGTEPEDVTITFQAGPQSITKSAAILPERKWEIYLVHQTHLDIGYTHTQPDVMNVQVDHIYKALDYIDQSKKYSEEEMFKWHPEGMWAVEEFLNHRASETDKNRFIQATRDKT
ncbi:MAG: hypothetical protein JXB18_08950, partial [Sedimentisphaerales bacterium]|nr:hypothetical protein [Sedimentisphaerales bacterium]